MDTKETADKLTEEVVTIIVKQILRGDADVIRMYVKEALDKVREQTIRESEEWVKDKAEYYYDEEETSYTRTDWCKRFTDDYRKAMTKEE